MDKRNIERPEKFDQKEYKKAHYARFCYNIKPELKQEIDDYCKELNISKPEFLRLAIKTLKNQ